MAQPVRALLCTALALLLPGGATAQPLEYRDRPARHVPVRLPSATEKDRQEAVKLYALGLLQERRNRLVEATSTLEDARKLDPESAAILKALIPLYLALDRVEDGLAACRKALELNPDDHETGLLYGRQLRGLNRRKEAIAVLQQASSSPGLKDRPDLKAQVAFDLAVLYEQESKWAEAEKQFRSVVALLENPAPILELGISTREDIQMQTAETYEKLGAVCLKAGRTEAAIAAFEKARAADPSRSARLAYHEAQVYEEQGKPREALKALEQYLRTMPSSTDGYERKLKLLRKLGRQSDIVPELAAASARDPHNTELRLILAREYRQAGQSAQAQGVYEELLKRAPSPEVYKGLFALHKDAGKLGGARALALLDRTLRLAAGEEEGREVTPADGICARAALAACRDDAALVRLLLEAARARLHAGGPGGSKLGYTTRTVLATLAGRTNQLDTAEDMYRSCLDRPGGLRNLEAEVYSGLLEVLTLKHRYREVVDLSKRGLEHAQVTNRVLFHRARANAEQMLGNWDEALKAADNAINEAGAGQILSSKRLRVQILSEAGKHDLAIAECQALLTEYNAGNELRAVRISLSSAYLSAGKPDQSEEQLELILKAEPNDALANNNLGYQWADRNKNLDEAEKLIRKALELDARERAGAEHSLGADNAAYLDSLGWVLFRKGKLEEARKELERASQIAGGDNDPVVWDHLGDVYFRLKRPEDAAKAWKKAVALYEEGARRPDERFKEIKDKLRLTKP